MLSQDIIPESHVNASDERFMLAFGANLLHSDGGKSTDAWWVRWLKVVHLKSLTYDLPGGARETD